MKNLAWTPVLLALALTGCPDKDTGDTDPGTDTEVGTDPDSDTDSDPDSDTDTEADTEPPGPQAGDVVYFEGFETDGTAFPDGWTTVDGATPVFWFLCATGDACNTGIWDVTLNAAAGDFYARIDSDANGSSGGSGYTDTLTSPVIDLSEYGDFGLRLSLDEFYNDFGAADSALMEASSDGGTTWTEIVLHTADTANGTCPSQYDVSDYAGGDMQVRFTWTGNWDFGWLLDNITLTLTDGPPVLPEGNAWDCPPEVCDSGEDEDLDGDIDCADSDCAEEAQCQEVCDSGSDEDADGFADCLDSDCTADDACTDVCVADPLTATGSGQGSTPADMTSDLDWASGPDCGFGAGPELVFSVDAVAGDVISARELSGSFDATVRILDGCSAGTATCLTSVDGGDATTFTVETDGTYYVVIEAFSALESDDFEYVVGLNPTESEVCDSGADDDLDGRIDCDDDDCFNTVECPYECPAEIPMVFTDGLFEASGDFADLTALPYDDGEGCGDAFGVGQIWEVPVEAGQQIEFAETGSSDTVVRVLGSCAPGDACLDSSDTPEVVRYQAGDSAETVYFVMEAWSSGTTSGAWAITATLIPSEDCSTDIDEDDDGDIGCDDSDCAFDAACYELDCADNASGDDDELIDCMDPDCDDSVDCVELDCTDGVDNEGDGFTDCLDTQCIGTAACPEIACDDGADNDDDNAIDCEDSDCDDALICYECPAPAALPLTLSGLAWLADNPDLGVGFSSGGGCRGEGTGDYILTIDALQGQIFTATDNDDADMYINITQGGCNAAQTDNTCLFNDDDESGSGSGIDNYSYEIPEDGTYYVYVTTFSSSSTREYDITFNVVEPEQCETDVDEDQDGDAGCLDSECTFAESCWDCPDALTSSEFPINLTGTSWIDDYPDLYRFSGGGGCLVGSTGSTGGGDYLFVVDMAVGDTVFTSENSGTNVDFTWNVTTGGCNPELADSICEDSVDDGPSDGDYSYTAVTAGLHYFTLAGYGGTFPQGAYDVTIDFTAAP